MTTTHPSTKERYLVGKPRVLPATLRPFDASPLRQLFPHKSHRDIETTLSGNEIDLQALRTLVDDSPELDLLRTLDAAEQNAMLVVAMTSEQVTALQRAYGERLLVEPDEPLELFGIPRWFSEAELMRQAVPLDKQSVKITVKGGDPSRVVPNAFVYALGSAGHIGYDRKVTTQSGQATLTLYGEGKDALSTLIVKPVDTYWSFVSNGEVSELRLKPLLANEEEVFDWGCRAMRLDQVPDAYRGQGIRVGVIDSGLYHDHEDLNGHQGHDLSNDASDSGEGWKTDLIGHGTHVTGTIAALHNGLGIKGFAPEADIFVFKVFPGGRFSDLIESLQRCIDAKVDVVNLSLGSSSRSELLHQQIELAKEAGVACIAAAGNSAEPVQYPAAFPEVLAVAAVGKFGAFPEDSHHSQLVGEHTSGDYFTASFTCFGQEIDVCAPGVAIVSCSVSSPSSYTALDGTSMSCPHVAGLATLILQKRQDIRKMQGGQRVDALFQAIKESCIDLGLPGDYQGAGLPDALRALQIDALDEQPWQRLDELLAEAVALVKAEIARTLQHPADLARS